MLEKYFLFDHSGIAIETGTYALYLVVVSYIVAFFASYALLDFISHIHQTKNKKSQNLWQISGALVMGGGVWSMHFIGMLAFEMDMRVRYDWVLTALSVLPAILVSYFVIDIVKRAKMGVMKLCISAILMGLGIAAMHYAGMAAMIMDADVYYDPTLFLASILIAIFASGASLLISFMITYKVKQNKAFLKICSAMLMAAAVCGMHYVGVEATIMVPWADCRYDPNQSFVGLAVATALITITIIVWSLVFSIYTSKLSAGEQQNGSHFIFSYYPVVLTFLMGFVISFFTFYLVKDLQTKELRKVFASEADSFLARFESKIISYNDILTAIEALFNSSDFVSRDEFEVFVYDYLVKKTDVKSIMFVLRLPLERLDEYIDQISAETGTFGLKNYVNGNIALVEQSQLQEKPYYYPVHYIEPYDENIFLTDISSFPSVEQALDRSDRGASTVLSYPYHPAQGRVTGHELQDMVMVRPLLFKPLNPEDRKDLQAFRERIVEKYYSRTAYLAMEIDFIQVMTEILRDEKFQNMNVRAYVLTGTGPLKIFDNSAGMTVDEEKQVYTNYINKFGAEWAIDYWPKNKFSDQAKWQQYLVLIGGVLFAFIISLYALTLIRQRVRDQVLQKSLSDKNEELQRISSALNVEKKYLDSILDNMMQAVVAIDEFGTIKSFNVWAERMFGYTEGELQGRNINCLMPEPYHSQHDGYLARYKKTGKKNIIGTSRNVDALKKDGSVFPVSLSVTRVEIEDEIVFIGLMADITEQRTREEMLRLSKDQADRANNAKSSFLANMSHEFRTPLNSIMGMSRMLTEDKKLDQGSHEMVGIIYMSANLLLEIVNDILDISKIEAGGLELERIGFDFKRVVSSVVDAMAPIASEKGIVLNQNWSVEKLPPLVGDPLRVNRVLTNLVSNAIKYSDKGDIEITIKAVETGPHEIEIYCAVQDQGVGIASDKIEQIFDKFTQSDVSTTRRFGGTGLGLSITKELISMMGGEIGAESQLGKGSTFWFKIPFLITDTIEENTVQDVRGFDSSIPRIAVSEARVLVAEDHLFNQELIKRMLERLNFNEVVLVENGKEAVDACQEKEFSLILMDCHMPIKNGYEATEDIRRLEEGSDKKIPIVALTADAMKGTKEKCHSFGMDEYVTKPIDTDELKFVMSKWIDFSDAQEVKIGTSSVTRDPEDQQVLNPHIINEYSDSMEDMERFVDLFIVQSDLILANIAGLCVDGENEEWVDECHKFKGSAGMVGAELLFEAAKDAQEMKDATADERRAILHRMQAEYEDVKRAMRSFVEAKT
jgi:PAS domain S-box-containing protein